MGISAFDEILEALAWGPAPRKDCLAYWIPQAALEY